MNIHLPLCIEGANAQLLLCLIFYGHPWVTGTYTDKEHCFNHINNAPYGDDETKQQRIIQWWFYLSCLCLLNCHSLSKRGCWWAADSDSLSVAWRGTDGPLLHWRHTHAHEGTWSCSLRASSLNKIVLNPVIWIIAFQLQGCKCCCASLNQQVDKPLGADLWLVTYADAADFMDVCDLCFTHPLLAGLEPVGEAGCSGSRFTRQDGKEQPSPRLESQERKGW